MKKKDKKRLYRIILSAILLAVAVVIDHVGILSGVLEFSGFAPLILALYLIPYVIIGGGVLKKALQGIIHGQVFDENFLMGIATIGAFCTGEYAEGVFVMLFYSVGELFEHIAVGKSRNSIKALLSLQADEATVIRNGESFTVDCESVEVGEMILVRPGEKIPLDAKICEGESTVDTSALTGESLPREVSVGDEIHSGCINLGGVIYADVAKRYEESTVSKILSLVEDSAQNKSKSESFITKFARFYTPAVVIAAVLLAILPPLFIGIGDPSVWKIWVYRALTFLVISCPCALVISVPLSYFSGIGSASSRGILIKGSAYLDTLAHCDTIVFDKTGTLTEGRFRIDEVHSTSNIDPKELLRLAALAEQFSNHPISRSIVEAAGEIDSSTPTTVEEIFGHGVNASVDGDILLVGNDKLMKKFGITPLANTDHSTVVHVAKNGLYLGYILISDKEKSGAREALASLRRAGIEKTVMLTGDRAAAGKQIGKQLGIDEIYTELLPDGKVSSIEKIIASQKNGKKVAYVGDGINDAPVITRADVGIAMGALGSDAAIEAADIVLMDDELSKITDTITLARRTRMIVIQNIVFALGIKAAVLVLGACGLVGLNAAVFADVGVAVIAILNSMRNLKK